MPSSYSYLYSYSLRCKRKWVGVVEDNVDDRGDCMVALKKTMGGCPPPPPPVADNYEGILRRRGGMSNITFTDNDRVGDNYGNIKGYYMVV